MTIQILPPEVSARIAAGEVIDRPASVVKELVENSLDAGASRIRIELDGGGKSLIKVIDDGCGIDKSDLEKLFCSHATSKISSEEDLFRIVTYGFRGEAIKSISSVSKCTIATCVAGSDVGYSINCSGEDRGGIAVVSNNRGTVVEVRELFFNVPARKKFLRRDSTEEGRIKEVIIKMALARHDVRFECLDSKGHLTVYQSADGIKQRISEIFGQDVGDNLVKIEDGAKGVEINGYVCSPNYSTVSSRLFYSFVNNRYIRDPFIHRSVMNAFSEFLPSGRNPVYFIYLKVSPSEVDVNVHPTKTEVRFNNYSDVGRLVYNSVKGALSKREIGRPVMDFIGGAFYRVDDNDGVRRPSGGRYKARYIGEVKTHDSLKEGPGAQHNIPLEVESAYIKGKRYVQLHGRFIVEEADHGISIIDQHALHERIILEDLRNKLRTKDLTGQYLIFKSVLKLQEKDKALLLRNKSLLETIGLNFEEFGREQIRIISVPGILKDYSPETLCGDIIAELNAHNDASSEHLLDSILSMIACKSAARFGDKLSEGDLGELLERRKKLTVKDHCAHGRLMEIKLTFDDLYKLFQRK